MTFVGKVLEGFKERMIATFYYSTLPFAAVPVFYNKLTASVDSEETESDINKFFSIFMPVLAILGDIFLIKIGLISLALASVAALIQILFLPIELLVASIEDGWSSEEEYVAGNPDDVEPGTDYQMDYSSGTGYKISQDANYDITSSQDQDDQTYETERQHTPNFGSAPKEEQTSLYIDPFKADEFLKKYGPKI